MKRTRVSDEKRPSASGSQQLDAPLEHLSSLSDDAAAQGATLLKALADPARLQILGILSQQDGEVYVCDLEGVVGIPDPETGQRPRQATISHHLRVLREAGLVDYEKRGHWAHYYVLRERLAMAQNLLASIGADNG